MLIGLFFGIIIGLILGTPYGLRTFFGYWSRSKGIEESYDFFSISWLIGLLLIEGGWLFDASSMTLWHWATGALFFLILGWAGWMDSVTGFIMDELIVALFLLRLCAPSFWVFGAPLGKMAGLGFLLGMVSFLMLFFAGKRFFDGETVGGGDIKLVAALGFWTGPFALIQVMVYAVLLGSLWALIHRYQTIHFAPFLLLGTVAHAFWPLTAFM